jgi:hypothetical protein
MNSLESFGKYPLLIEEKWDSEINLLEVEMIPIYKLCLSPIITKLRDFEQ